MKKLEQCTQEMQLLKDRCDDKDRELDKLKRELAHSQKENFKPRDSFQFGNKQVEPPRCWHCGSSQHFRAQCPESRRGGDVNHKSSEYSRGCLLYTSPSPRDLSTSRMPSSA